MLCCELLLFLEIMIFATAFKRWKYKGLKVVNCFCSLKFWYLQQHGGEVSYFFYVVNCFCSLKLWYLQQLLATGASLKSCCELLLFLEIMIFATAALEIMQYPSVLWIAFVPWNYDICNSKIFFIVNQFSLWIAFVPWNYDICNSSYPVDTLGRMLWIAFVPWNYDICNSGSTVTSACVTLWIAFVPWNYDICNSYRWVVYEYKLVVNCFCSLKLWYLQQPNIYYCIFLYVVNCFCSLKLWYLQQRQQDVCHYQWVVNCFCSLKLWYLQQQHHIFQWRTGVVNCFCSLKLWYLQQRIACQDRGVRVVNCFCSLKLWYLQQLFGFSVWWVIGCELLLFLEIMIFATAKSDGRHDHFRCELLLFLEIMIFATARNLVVADAKVLWIAFVPWNYDICNSIAVFIKVLKRVVNCFCSLKLWYLQQPDYIVTDLTPSCELLLFLEIMIFATALQEILPTGCLLWIAFVPWNYDICNSRRQHPPVGRRLWIAFVPWNYDICNSMQWRNKQLKHVVNCFCSLKLWYLQQLQLQQYL